MNPIPIEDVKDQVRQSIRFPWDLTKYVSVEDDEIAYNGVLLKMHGRIGKIHRFIDAEVKSSLGC